MFRNICRCFAVAMVLAPAAQSQTRTITREELSPYYPVNPIKVPSAVYESYTENGITFSTGTPQSAWGSGNASQISDRFEATQSWNASEKIGGMITSGPNPNPLWLQYEACIALNVGVCVAPDSNIHGPRTISIPKSGAELSLSTSGTIGAAVEYNLTAGSVNPQLSYNVSANVPTLERSAYNYIGVNGIHQIDGTAQFTGGAINAVSPSVTASSSVIFEMDLSASAEGCIAGECYSGSADLVDIARTELELIGFDSQRLNLLKGFTDMLPFAADISLPVGEVEAVIQRGTPKKPSDPAIGVVVNTNPIGNFPAPPWIDLASVKAEFPTINIAGTKSGEEVTGDGDDRFVTALADLDGLLDQIPPGGAGFSVGPSALNAGVTLEAFDIDAGVTLDVYQEMTLTQDLMVRLDFSQPLATFHEEFVWVVDDGAYFQEYNYTVDQHSVTSWTGRWEDIPYMYFFSSTEVTPTFFTEVSLSNEVGLQFGLAANVSAGKAAANVGWGPTPLTGTLGPLVNEPFSAPLEFARFSVFDQTFDLGGFNEYQASPFLVQVNSPSGPVGPGPIAPMPAPVPLPASGWALLAGLISLFGIGRSRRLSK